MTRNLLRAGAISCALLTTTALTAPAKAQALAEFRHVDSNGVDLVHGVHLFSFEEGSIGSGRSRISLVRQDAASNESSQWDGYLLTRTSSQVEIRLPGRMRETFAMSSLAANGTVVTRANGSRLIKNERWSYTYVRADGTSIAFGDPSQSYDSGFPPNNFCTTTGQTSCVLLPETMSAPDGQVIAFNWDLYGSPGDPEYLYRLASVGNSFGYGIGFSYASNTPPTNWHKRTGAVFTNASAGSGAQASVSYAYPSTGVTEITDMAGDVWRIEQTSAGIAIRRPGASADTFATTTSGGVLTVTNEGVATTYARVVSGSTATMTVTDALSRQTVIESDLTIGRPISVTDALMRETQYSYTDNLLTRITAHEGNYVEHTRDTRGNITATAYVPKSGSGLSTITTSATFAGSCTSMTLATCNLPISTTDARGNVTDYAYDGTTGLVTSITGPTPSSGAARPQVRYSYTATNGISLLTGMSTCATAATGDPASCVGTAAESREVIAYDSAGNVTSVTRRDGTGTLSAVEAMTYDARGNLLTVDGPLSGTADTTRMRYDAGNRLTGMVSADPDGSGSLPHRAMRTTFTNGLPVKQEVGTVASQSDTDWAAMTVAQEMQTVFDGNARATVSKLVSGSTVYSLTQVTYDALGRAECTAQRMNPAEFGALPTSACTLDTEGTFGPDRIVRTTYDELGRPKLVRSAVGTAIEGDEVAATYTANGQLETLTDGENNRTTYVYDGFDRLRQTQFPLPTTDLTSSTTDYEELTYDAGGNVINVRLRDNTNIAMTYDALGRPTLKNLPGSEPDVNYNYDLLGRLTSAATSAQTLSFTHDALGRQLTETGALGTLTSSYDLAGRRTRLTYPGSFYVDYDHLVTGETAAIRENGATSGAGVLATFGYDDLGRRTGIARGNGAATGYSYDAAGRLASLNQDLSGTANDLTLAFSYNPAGQIAGSSRSNDAYSFTGLVNANVTDTHNGLNQLTQAGTANVTHDARGNVSAIGSNTYSYNSENMLTGTGGGATLTYDPLRRLIALDATADIQYLYDGNRLVGTYDGNGNLVRRFVHGPGVDEPLVGLKSNGERRHMHADERGSLIGNSDESAGLLTAHTYDDYGASPTVAGPFGYTGQMNLSEIGLHSYKARMYHPGLGRFMQADPIGYGDGINMYGYVGGDPVNFRDPSGMCEYGYTATEIYHVLDDGTEKYVGRDPGSEVNFGWYGCSISDLFGNVIGSLEREDLKRLTEKQFSNPSRMRQIRDSQRRVVEACRRGATPVRCAQVRREHSDLWQQVAREAPLPGPFRFERVRPDLLSFITGAGSCAAGIYVAIQTGGVSTGLGVVGSSGLVAGCLSTVLSVGEVIIPPSRRLP